MKCQQKISKKFLIKPQMTKTCQDNNLNYIQFLKHFDECHTEKLKYRDEKCLILNLGFAMMNLLNTTVFVATFSHFLSLNL